jgi:hypothetical protein
MKVQKDILGIKPSVGDTIIFNPAKYKGLIYGECKGFTKAGLPEVEKDYEFIDRRIGQANKSGYYTPKTGFVCIKNN